MRFQAIRSHFAGKFSRRLAAAAACVLALGAARAEDIDIFTGKPLAGNPPNILVIIDSSSNWAATFGTAAEFAAAGCPTTDLTKFGAEMCVLKQVVSEFTADVRLGLMMFAESGENGGYVRWAIRNMGLESSASKANRDGFVEMLNNFVKQGTGTDNSGSNQPYGKVMFEAFKYFGGGTGTNKSRTAFGTEAFAGWTSDVGGDTGTRRRDYKGNNSGSPTGATANRAAQRYNADDFTAFSGQTSRSYIPPIVSLCPKNFIIFISNGNPSTGGDAGGTASATQLLANVGGNTAQIASGGAPVHASTMDEWARFLYNADVDPNREEQQNIITYTVAVYQPTGYRITATGAVVKTKADCAGAPCTPIASNTDNEMIKLMRSAADAGHGVYFDGSDISGIKAAFARMLNEVQAKNSVFVSASLPVSVNTQGTFLNQVYMGMFRPEPTGLPRWLGNLKHYKIIQDPVTQNLTLADSLNQPAVNPATGFVSPVARSFWTSASTFWVNTPSGTPPTGNDLPDGEIVEKGGAGEQIRRAYLTSQATRRVYTCPDTGCPAGGALAHEFNPSNVSGGSAQAQFGASTPAELTALVNWIRGTDNVVRDPCDPADTVGCANPSWKSAEGGPNWPVTVRPSVHGDVLHARPVVLNYPTHGPYVFYGANDGLLRGTKGGRLASDGMESWAFVAPEFYPKFKRLRDASPILKFPTTPAGIVPAPQPKDYFFDGAIGSYQNADQTQSLIFVTARRGGRFIYAFDVSTPTSPRFLWKITPASAGFGELGQTWSEPKAFKVRAFNDPVVIFGAGYDAAEDSTPAGARTMGRGVYVVNAITGTLIKFFSSSENGGSIASAVPSDIAVIDRDFDTLGDRAYVGDMTGNVWRMDIDDADVANWKMYKLASLGAEKKFFFRPDVVISKDYDLVLIGSGDREKPIDGTSKDRFYMIKDDKTGKSGAGITIVAPGDLVAGDTDSSAAKGWYIEMREGEKVINAPLSIGGVTYFSTNRPTPDPTSCEPNLGEARAYAVDFLTGGAGADRNGDGTLDANDISIKLKGGGLPPSPVGGVVQLDDGRLVDFVIGSGAGGSPIAPERPPRNIPKIRKKLFWNANFDR